VKATQALLVACLLWPSPVWARGCHHFRVWNYPYPQRCYTALVVFKPAPPVKKIPVPEFPLPFLDDIVWDCNAYIPAEELGRLRALALLRGASQ